MAIPLIVYLLMLLQDTATAKVSLQSRVDATNFLVQKGLEKQQLQKAEIAELEKKVAELEVTRDVFTGVLHDFSWHQEMVNGDLKLITLALPGGVDLSRITYTGDSDTLKISGMSPGEEEVLAYASDLRDSGRFPRVTISTMKQTETETETETETGMDFTLTLGTKEKD